MSDLRIIEIGASTILDFMQTKSWTKIIHNHAPKWGKPISMDEVTLNSIERDQDIIFVSMGFKESGNDDRHLIEFLECPSHSRVWNSCIAIPAKIVNKLLSTPHKKNRLIVYLDSISAETTVAYPTSVEYAISKVAMSTYLKNLSYRKDNLKVLDIHIGSTKTRMCNHGMDPEYVFNKIMLLTEDFWNHYNDHKLYETFTINELNGIKNN